MATAPTRCRPAPQPLYQQVKTYIEARIVSGQWPPEMKIPSENELVAALGVSRMTVNRAFRELAAAGHLIRVQGVGTFVAPPKPQSALLEIRSIADEIHARGGTHTARVLQLCRETAPAEVAAAMQLAPDASVFHSILVHCENDRPVMLADRFVNPALAPHYLEQDFSSMTPSQYLMAVIPLTEAEHVIEARLPDREIQARLDISDREPCLVLTRRTWSRGKVATRSRFTYPGSRYRLGSRFRPASAVNSLIA
jgi:GntR family histidine utilization transcriptional repressor